MKDLTTPYRSLLAAAKADAPSAATKAKVWSAVHGSIAGAASTGVAVGGSSGVKTLLFGALLGGTVTVGLASALLCLRVDPRAGHAGAPLAGRMRGSENCPVTEPAPGGRTLPPRSDSDAWAVPAVPIASAGALSSVPAPGEHTAPPPAHARIAPAGSPKRRVSLIASGAEVGPAKAPPDGGEDPLGREAALLGRARAALAHGQAAAALAIVHAAASLPGRQLVPEELAIEGQALKALGRNEEADALGAGLRALYPESALGR